MSCDGSMLGLSLPNNRLSGTLPIDVWARLGALDHLAIFNVLDPHNKPVQMNANTVSGTMPTQLGLLRNATRVLALQGTPISGTVPSQLGTMSLVSAMYLGGMLSLSGSLYPR
mgnify:CR=1 FL=1